MNDFVFKSIFLFWPKSFPIDFIIVLDEEETEQERLKIKNLFLNSFEEKRNSTENVKERKKEKNVYLLFPSFFFFFNKTKTIRMDCNQ